MASTRPPPTTCRPAIAVTPTGLSAVSAGTPPSSGRQPSRSAILSWSTGRTPNRASDPASASCGWRGRSVSYGWKPPPRVPSRSVRSPTDRSVPSSTTNSIDTPRTVSYRRDRRLLARLRYARLRHQASVEDVDYRAARGLDRALFQKLADGSWIEVHENLLICGPAGVGKSWLASALGHKACRDNRSVLYQRIPRLFADLALARGDGRHLRLLRALGRVDLLILDDWGLEPLDAAARHDLLEILDDRYGRRSTVVTSQLPVDRWHQLIGDPTYADAILDRLVHNAHRLDLTGESLRRQRPQLRQKT